MSSMAFRIFFTKGKPEREIVATAIEEIAKEIRKGLDGGFIRICPDVPVKWKAYAILKEHE